MRCFKLFFLVALATCFAATTASAAFLIEIDTDGADNGALAFSPNFSFGGDTTTASQSSPSNAPFLSGADSIFGGNGAALPDTYVYTYDPAVDADNTPSTAGVRLGFDLAANEVFGTGSVGGAAGDYLVYAAWPDTSNVSGGDTQYAVDAATDSFSVIVNQGSAGSPNGANDPNGDDTNDNWVLLGTVAYDGVNPIVVTQSVTVANSFVSMRASAVMFEPVFVPEPTSAALAFLTVIGLAAARRR